MSLTGAHPSLFTQSRPAMGTTFTICLFAPEARTAAATFEQAFAEIERLEETLSHYRESSEISRINRLASHSPVTTDPEVFGLLRESLAFSRITGGAFDITSGPLMRAWGFFRGSGRIPAPTELERARVSTGWNGVKLESQSRTIHFSKPAMELDLGSIGKGYAVDRVVALLVEAGVTAALVDAGSSTLYGLGAPPGHPGWKVHIPRPGNRSEMLSTLTLCDQALSTSGSYEKFFEYGGRKYCHILDPRTGAPVEGKLQTTAVAHSGVTAEALSTAMFVMEAAAGRELIARSAGSKGFWVLDGERVIYE